MIINKTDPVDIVEVGDSAKGKTANIRAVFYIYGGTEATISSPRITITKAAETGK